MSPSDLRYTKDHEWVRVTGDRGTVGITDYAQKQLGDVVYLELPAEGTTLTPNQTFGSVESVKAVSELLSPVAGEVVVTNAALVEKPEAINSDPYGAGWMLVVKLADPKQLDGLMDGVAYDSYVAAESK